MGLFSQSSGFANVEDLMQEEQTDPVLEVEQEVMAEQTSLQTQVEVMSEVRIRMHKAKYYEALLQNPLFGPNQHPLASEVEAEVREFVMERLCVFLGMKPEAKAQPQASEVFDEEQIGALTMLANRILKRPLMAGSTRRPQVDEPPQVHAAVLRQDIPVAVRQPTAAVAPPVPVQQPQPKTRTRLPGDAAPRMMQHPLTGKMVPVSSLVQAKPEGIKPTEQPTSGNFAASSQGNFVDMTGGAAAAAATAAVSQGVSGAGIHDPAVHGQLIQHFLKK